MESFLELCGRSGAVPGHRGQREFFVNFLGLRLASPSWALGAPVHEAVVPYLDCDDGEPHVDFHL